MTVTAGRFISGHHITAPQESTMASEPEPKKPRDRTRMALVLVLAAIVVSVGTIGYATYIGGRAGGGTQRAIINGDTVTLDYIGMLPDGRVFDTSILSVAKDNANYTKSLTFTLRSDDSYKPLSMTAGNYGAGGTIKGFALGVLGMHVGDQKLIEVPPEDGYPLLPDMLTTFNLTDHIPITQVMTEDQFSSTFGVEPISMDVVTHPFWQWNVLVTEVSGGLVTIKSEPSVGQSVYPYGNPNSATAPGGWEIKVIGYDPTADGGIGSITIRNMVTAADVYNVKGTDSSGNALIIWSFDEMNQTFQVHRSDSSIGYNAELAGRTLYFEVTVVSVVPYSG
jgi:FKBP-type peptidyl-prolyl cis-trans isomerase 2